MFRATSVWRWLTAVLLLAAPTLAQAEIPQNAVRAIEGGLAKLKGETLSNDVRDYLRKSLEDPARLNKVLDTYLEKDSGLAFLKDINFRFKAFQPVAPDQETSLGVSYDYAKSIINDEWGGGCGPTCARGYDFSFSARGNVAFDSDRNPDNFLETKLSFAIFQSTGGAKELTQEGKQEYSRLALKAAQAQTDKELDAVYADILRLIANALTDQYYFDLSGEFSLESNQSFSAKQYVYGARIGVDVKGWAQSGAKQWHETSLLARLNVFDYPFALVRMLTGYDGCGAGLACFVPRGTNWPTAALTLARVKPEDGDPRLAVGASSDYDRVAGEISFKTPIARVSGEKVFFSANYRLYQELDASSAVELAGLDRYHYTALAIGSVTGPYISYTRGRLPLDARNDTVYELGYQTHF